MVAAHPSLRLVSPDLDVYEELDAPEVAGRIGFADDVTSHSAPRLAGADRRIFPRQALSLRVRGRRLEAGEDVRSEPFLNLNIEDVSVGGLRAKSQTRLNVGERVTVFFPPQGNDRGRGWDAYGRVIRVLNEQHQPGCEIAVEFDSSTTPLAA